MGKRGNRSNKEDINIKPSTENVPEINVETKKIKPGDRVKLHKDLNVDIVGRRIHNGIKNYAYTVKVVRDDGYITIECMTYILTVSTDDVDLI